MNRITIGQYEFTDETILENPQKFISNSMLADALEIDTLEFSVYSLASGVIYIITDDGYTFATSGDEPYVVDEGYLINTPYATPVYLYKDDVLRAKFYTKSIQRTGLTSYRVQCVSAIGLLDGARTVGGVYEGESAVGKGWDKVSNMLHGSSGRGFNIPLFANGGFPSSGDLFIANEQAPELVGSFGNRTAVYNQDQFAGAMAVANQQVVQAVLAIGSQITGAVNNKPVPSVRIGDRDIFNASQRGSTLVGSSLIQGGRP